MKTLLMALLLMSVFSCKSSRELITVKQVDIHKYAGNWYEIARLPNRFEKGLECVTAQYTVQDNGKIEVRNKGLKTGSDGNWKDIKGSAKVPDPNFPGRLKVTFFWPFAGDYYIIELDENYQFALVGDPSRNYLWVLAREKSLDDRIYNDLLSIAKAQGFMVDNLVKINQACDH